MADEFILSNATQDVNAQCKIVVYNWKHKAPLKGDLTDTQLSESKRLDISSQILGCNYSKNMGGPTGSFTITLSNSPGVGSGDWKDIIKRGEWCSIYMSQEGDLTMNPQVGTPLRASRIEENKKLRCIGFIDRVAPAVSVNENGSFDIVYEITGRDFGVVYEDTTIWHNLFQFDRAILESLANDKLNIIGNAKLKAVLDVVHDLFFNPGNLPGAKVNSNKSLTSTALQWLLPRQLIRDVFGSQSSGGTFWGELPGIKNFQETEAGLAVEKPTDFLTGNAWEQLRKAAVTQFHELYTEMSDDGIPQLNFRPIPFAINKTKYPIVGRKVQYYKDLPFVSVPAVDVLNYSLGEDNHGRYNSFLATVSTSLINTEDNISILTDSGFPSFNQSSIKRYGFRPMHVTVDSIIKNAQKDDGKSDRKLLIEFNELLKDYWEKYVFTDSGTIEHIGRNTTRLGKAIVYQKDVPYIATRRYYIEGYSDSYVVTENGSSSWTQTIKLTRGIEEDDLKRGFADQRRDTPFTQQGEFTPSTTNTNKKGDN